MPKGLYIHIPFCDHICTYCDFPKIFTQGQSRDHYIDALIEELKQYEQRVGFSTIETLYFGGGTPTALTIPQLKKLFDYLKEAMDFSCFKEISMEANPENLTPEKIDFLVQAGVNRMSLGVQTFDETLLKQIGRKHAPEAVIEAVQRLKARGLTNINLDLIYSIPGQTLDQVQRDLEQIMALDVPHVSAYSLIVEEHTQLYLAYMKDKVALTDPDLEAMMYELVIDTLKNNGFEHYEISNFSKELPSLHNQWYWLNEEYIGTGLGAHGYVHGARYHNTRSITAYLNQLKNSCLPLVESNKLLLNERIEEEMFLGMRLTRGVNLNEINEKYNVQSEVLYKDALERLEGLGYINWKEGRVWLTRQGLLLANEVFEQFLLT